MTKEKNYYTITDIFMLDNEGKEFIPLTMDGMFKGIFKKNTKLLKDLILSLINLDIDKDMCELRLLDSELAKDKYLEYQKTVDLYVSIDNIYVNIEINREYFKNIEYRNFLFADKLYTMLLRRGENAKTLKDKMFIQINLNAKDKFDKNNKELTYGTDTIVNYGINTGKIYNNNKLIYVKFIEYYRNKYYNDGKQLTKDELWLALLASKSYTELYNISKELFGEKESKQFIKDVIDMNNEEYIFKEWEIEKLNEVVNYTIEENAKKEGHEKGIKEGRKEGLEQGLQEGLEKAIKQTIINMLKEKIDIDLISKITNKSIEEINSIKSTLK